MTKPDYTLARILFFLVSLVGWLVIVAGVLMMFSGFGGSRSSFGGMRVDPGAAAVMGGIPMILLGFVVVAGAQIGRAVIDNARISWEMLELMRAQQGAIASAGQIPGAKTKGSEKTIQIKDRSGKFHSATLFDDGTVETDTPVGKKRFSSETEAQQYFA